MSQFTILLLAAAAAGICLMAERLHARRIARIARLAFADRVRQGQLFAAIAGGVRSLAIGLLVWAGLTLLTIDGAAADTRSSRPPDQHLILAIDVSPSMYLTDAGAGGTQSRQRRAGEVLESVLERLDLSRTRVSIIAFYTAARPVVVDTSDINVVKNILYDLPLGQAFKPGLTNMYEGVRAAARIAAPWPAGSATLVVVSDGDTSPDTGARIELPRSIADALIIGVGDPYRASAVGDRSSRQDAQSLKRLAAQMRGIYHDGNRKNLPTQTLRGLTMIGLRADHAVALRTMALLSAGIGAVILASVSPFLARFGPARATMRVAPWCVTKSIGRTEGALT